MKNKNDICFIYVVGGNDNHYNNLKNSIRSVRKIYPSAKILIGDFDLKFNFDDNLIKIIDLSQVKINKEKIYKHIIWQYKYYVAQFSDCQYNLYLDTDTVLANNLNNLIEESNSKFVISKHFWIPTVFDFLTRTEKQAETYEFIKKLDLDNNTNFCAAGVFFFEKNEKNLSILKNTFDIHNKIYSNRDYILGIYDETILSSVLQKNIDDVIYYNGSLNHCSMLDMPLSLNNGILYGKNSFDQEYKPVTCLHCDIFRRDPSQPYNGELKLKIKNLFNI